MLSLLERFQEIFGPFRLFGYVSVRVVAAALSSFLLMLLVMPRLIDWLRVRKLAEGGGKGEGADLVDEMRSSKAGTPTMGGIGLIVCVALGALLWCDPYEPQPWLLLFSLLAFGVLGYLDDRAKVFRGAHGLSKRSKTALQLGEAIASLRSGDGGLEGTSALDVGAGFGDVLLELFPRGLGAAFHVEASPAYSGAARDLTREAGFEDRVRFMVGDAVELAGDQPPPGNAPDGSGGTSGLPIADIVVLDRVVCCYPDMEALLDVTAARARDLYALSAPRSLLPVRAVIWLENLGRRLGKNPFRTFVHSWPAMDRRLAAHGFERAWEGGTLVWRLAVYRRNPGR